MKLIYYFATISLFLAFAYSVIQYIRRSNEDINEKYISEFVKLKEKHKITIIYIDKKEELLNIFSRNVNVIGIFGKKVVDGILNKMEVTNEDIRTG